MLLRFVFPFFAILAVSMFNVACVDQEFDTPPGRVVQVEDISNTSIKDLVDLVVANNGSGVAIPQGTIIKGEIVSDDNTGNMYKIMVIQDGTAGITLSINKGNLSTTFERGRTVYVDCDGLGIGNFNGLPQIGVLNGTAIERIEEVLLPNVLIAGELSSALTPSVRTLESLSFADLNTLVQFEMVEFADSESGNTYAVANGGSGQNRSLEDCDGNRVVVRNSDFSTFAGAIMPTGNGNFTGVYSVYTFDGFSTDVGDFGDNAQLLIRDTDDVDFQADRCDGTGGGGTGTGGEGLSIEDLRGAFSGTATTAPDGTITGTVISDIASGNTLDRNLYFQDGTAGIAVRFTGAHNYQLGDELKINVGGVALEEFNGLLQLNDLESSSVEFVSAGNVVSPQEVCVEDLLNNSRAYESTLVLLKEVTIDGGNVFSDNGITVSDMSGDIGMFTRFDANFSGDNLPSGSVDLLAVANNFNGAQIFIRNAGDIQSGTSSNCQGGGGGGGTGDPVDGISIDFQDGEGGEDFDPVTLTGWQNTVETGNRNWQKRIFATEDNGYAQATAFNDDDPAVDSWMITPPINMDVASRLNFDSAKAFYTHDGLTVYISTDFDGNNIASANWEVLDCDLAGASSDDHDWVNSGDVDLSAYSGEAHIAWRYEGTSGANTGTFRVDNIVVD